MEKKTLPKNIEKAASNVGKGFLGFLVDAFSHGDPQGHGGELISEDIPQRTMEERKYGIRDGYLKNSQFGLPIKGAPDGKIGGIYLVYQKMKGGVYDFMEGVFSSPTAQAALEENDMRALHCIVCFYESPDNYITYEITGKKVPGSDELLIIDQRNNESGIQQHISGEEVTDLYLHRTSRKGMMHHQWLYEKGKATEITHHRQMKMCMAKGMSQKKITDHAKNLCDGMEYDFAACNCYTVAKLLAIFAAGQ